MRLIGLEPTRLTATASKAIAANNYATNAKNYGLSGWTRTSDHMLPKQMRYQLRYTQIYWLVR